MSTSSHPSADWIYERVREKIPNISLGTVYRNLGLLEKAGEILELDFSDGVHRFDGNREEHYHFRCQRCGEVLDLKEAVDRTIEGEVARKTGFKVLGHRLEFFGICNHCQQPTTYPHSEYLPLMEVMT